MQSSIRFDTIDFHPALKDVEILMSVFVLQNLALTNPEIRSIMIKNGGIGVENLLAKYDNSVGLSISLNFVKNTYNSTMDKDGFLSSIVILGRVLAILIYDILAASSYYLFIDKMEEMQFLRYIRNGAAHSNEFDLKNRKRKWKLKENESIKWGEKEINRSLHHKIVFNDFINAFEVFLLANFFSDKLRELDKQ